jgi:hypothetical protein
VVVNSSAGAKGAITRFYDTISRGFLMALITSSERTLDLIYQEFGELPNQLKSDSSAFTLSNRIKLTDEKHSNASKQY